MKRKYLFILGALLGIMFSTGQAWAVKAVEGVIGIYVAGDSNPTWGKYYDQVVMCTPIYDKDGNSTGEKCSGDRCCFIEKDLNNQNLRFASGFPDVGIKQGNFAWFDFIPKAGSPAPNFTLYNADTAKFTSKQNPSDTCGGEMHFDEKFKKINQPWRCQYIEHGR